MKNVVFVAPYLAETTLRFVSAVAQQSEVRLAVLSCDPPERVPEGVRSRIEAFHRLRSGLDPAEILSAVEGAHRAWGGIDRLLGALEELQVPLGQIRDTLGIPGMSAATAELFRDKSKMKQVLRAAGLPCARYALAHSPEDAQAFVASAGFPLIVKPPAGSGAQSTFRLETEQDLAQCLHALPPSPDRPVLMEEFITGDEFSFDSISLDGRVVWHSINHYLPTPLEVLREPWIQWSVLLPREVDDPLYGDIKPVATAALAALGMDTGLSHMEWFRQPDGGVAISEVGARPPGARMVNLHSWAHDFDLFNAWARTVVHGVFEPRSRPFAAGAVYLRAQGAGSRVVSIHGTTVLDELQGMVMEARLPKVGQSPSGTYEGEGYIILRDPETERVREGLARILGKLRVELGS